MAEASQTLLAVPVQTLLGSVRCDEPYVGLLDGCSLGQVLCNRGAVQGDVPQRRDSWWVGLRQRLATARTWRDPALMARFMD